MPTPITPAATWTAVIPTPDDGEGATGAGLDNMAQPLANREEYLKSVVEGVGPNRIRSVETFADLKNLTPNDKDVTLVYGYGTYQFDVTITPGGDDLPLFCKPNVGPGQWYLAGAGAELFGTKIATVSSSKVVEPVPFRIVTVGNVQVAQAGDTLGTQFSTLSTTYVDVAGISTTATGQVGDIFLVWADGMFGTSGATDAFVQLWKVDGGVESAIQHCWAIAGATDRKRFSFNAMVSCGTTGAFTLKLKMRTSAGISSYVEKPASISWMQVRP